MNNNIYITGANGFLGHNLIKWFCSKKYLVTAVVRKNGSCNNLENLSCDVIEYDGSIGSLRKNMDENTIVIHTASYYIAEHDVNDLPYLINSNLEYGLHILEAMRISGARKILNIGTAWQSYEGNLQRPVNLYAATKQAFENFVAYYCDAEGFSSISLRLNDTYSEDDKRIKLLQLLINAGIKKNILKMSCGDQKINLSHISDVCSAIDHSVEMLLKKSNFFEKYNLLSKDEYSLKELVYIIETTLGFEIPVEFCALGYRKREVFIPEKSNSFPFYSQKVELRKGVELLYGKLMSENNAEK